MLGSFSCFKPVVPCLCLDRRAPPRQVAKLGAPWHNSFGQPLAKRKKRRSFRASAGVLMEISKLLWSPRETSSSHHRTRQPQLRGLAASKTSLSTPTLIGKSPGCTTTTKKCSPSTAAVSTYAVVPDKERKRCYHLSTSQKKARVEKEAFDSRELNLTLDINQLRQEMLNLTNYRALKITRLLLDRKELESDILKDVDELLFGARKELVRDALQPTTATLGSSYSFSGTLTGRSSAVRLPTGVCEFTLQLDRPDSQYRCGVFATTQVLSFVEEDTGADNEEEAEIRQICGGPGGCVVEAVGSLAGRLSREVVGSLFPRTTDNDVLSSGLIGSTITFPARVLLYFDAQHQLVRQVAQAGAADALSALRQTRPDEFAAITVFQVKPQP